MHRARTVHARSCTGHHLACPAIYRASPFMPAYARSCLPTCRSCPSIHRPCPSMRRSCPFMPVHAPFMPVHAPGRPVSRPHPCRSSNAKISRPRPRQLSYILHVISLNNACKQRPRAHFAIKLGTRKSRVSRFAFLPGPMPGRNHRGDRERAFRDRRERRFQGGSL